MSKPPNHTRPAPSRIDPQREAELIDRWFEVQRLEMENERDRTNVRNREIDNDKALAIKSIDAQLEDRKETRALWAKLANTGLLFAGVVVLMLLIFGGYVISQGKEAVLTEIISLLTELFKYGFGAVTGYFIAKAKYGAGSGGSDKSD